MTKGKKLRPDILTGAEVRAIMAAFPQNSPLGKRNRAIVCVMYALGMKVGQVRDLERADYNAPKGTLRIPGQKRRPAKVVPVDWETKNYLDEWVEIRRRLAIPPHSPFFCSIEGEKGNRMHPSTIRKALARKRSRLGIDKRVNPGSLKATYDHEQQVLAPQSVEARIGSYVDDDAFGSRFPEAQDKWLAAVDLYKVGATRHAGRIGRDCREALAAFANEMVRRQSVEVETTARTVDKLRAVIASDSRPGTRMTAFIDALVTYWGTVSDLVQRQVHAEDRQGESLRPEDARRVIFQTMLVMYEVDRALR